MNKQEVIISGVHMELTDAIKSIVTHKVEKLFRHQERIIRVRVELEHVQDKEHSHEFLARGIVEIHGPNLVVSVASDNLYKSVDELIDKLNRKLRRRARLSKVKRKFCHGVDIPSLLPKTNPA